MAIGDPKLMQGLGGTGLTGTDPGASPLDMINRARAAKGLMPLTTGAFDIQGPFGGALPSMAEQAAVSPSGSDAVSFFQSGEELFDIFSPPTVQEQIISSGLRDDPTVLTIAEQKRQEDAAQAQAQREAGQRRQEIISGIESPETVIDTDTTVSSAPTGEGTDAVEAATAAGVSPKGVAGADTPVRQATVTALDEYLRNARPGVKPENYKEYMKEFADATGLDVSGEPDNRAALMAFGLALMQNKAGKGFDVGAMLSSVGEAGEKALPSLQKARENAKAIRAKAGEYALGRKKEDEAAVMNRQEYLVIPKGDKGGPLGVVEAILEGKGQNVRLNAFELRNLDENEDFASQYEIVTVADYQDIVKEAFKTPEVQDLYQSGSSDVSLFTGAPKGVGLTVQLPDLNNPNAQGKKPGVLAGGPESLAYIRKMEKGLATGKGFFREIAGLLAQTDISVPSQARSAIVQTLRNLGLSAGGETDPVKQIQVMLTELKAKNAAEILGESGKTLSDNDRRMVSEIVGEISFTEGDEALLIQKLNRLYESVIGGREADLAEAYNTLNTYGISYGSDTRNDILGVTEDEEGTLYDATVD